jgi:hypothetical protein
MSVAATPAVRAPETALSSRAVFEYLLLGDLRLLLEEPIGPETNRWLLATLDMILASRPRPSHTTVASMLMRSPWDDETERFSQERSTLYEKLQRLRDRIAHRAPYALLANEIRCDLTDLMDR